MALIVIRLLIRLLINLITIINLIRDNTLYRNQEKMEGMHGSDCYPFANPFAYQFDNNYQFDKGQYTL